MYVSEDFSKRVAELRRGKLDQLKNLKREGKKAFLCTRQGWLLETLQADIDDGRLMDSTDKACPRVVTREEWGARPEKDRLDMETPVPFVILHHTNMPECFTLNDCCKMMRSIQDFHMDVRGWDDIAYSFLVGEDGLVYRGRGWDTVGSHAPWYNFRSLGISIMGNFTTKLPNKKAIEAVDEIINCAIIKQDLPRPGSF
ncbi:peptidoglycan-recognition protein LB-like isoform X2 [Lytechinus variegatus]|uniref:peptidoglycan-recognition protein LB-like isoform X2 n=1 Tax=Lytechinus variegatus TaxID=7654 RepID=UPI001BB29D3C|nr:peptidoglycan-recognition protein LB-like isoform X2 [Lytechinus variegatus]